MPNNWQCYDTSGNVTCAYSQTKPHIQNRNGWMNDKYNYSTKQYLERRCRSFKRQSFNFLSNQAIRDASGASMYEFLTSCQNSNINNNQGTSNRQCTNKCNHAADCSGCCLLDCNNKIGIDCSQNTIACAQTTNNCAKKGYTLCEASNNNCKAVYKRSNPRFSTQGAVSGGSRINRLKYQTQLKAQSVQRPTRFFPGGKPGTVEAKPYTTAANNNMTYRGTPYKKVNTTNGINSINGTYPVSLYRNTYPRYKSNLSGLCLGNMGLTLNDRPQRCRMPDKLPDRQALQTLPERCHFRCAPVIHHCR